MKLTKLFGLALGTALALWAVSCAGGRTAVGDPAAPGSEPPPPGSGAPLPNKAVRDDDRDGIEDGLELSLGTDPHSNDSDGDGLSDHWELWGCNKIPVGEIGSLTDLPDANGNGVHAALDPADMGLEVLKQASAVLGQQRVPAIPPDEGYTLPNDMDGDGIPNDFELHGFCLEYDNNAEPWLVKWDGEYYSSKYFKTDPLQWSTDGDPFSDWEEATKINLDQRVKFPGDHPCIPAYPDVHFVLDKYTITLNQDVVIESRSGQQTEGSWTNGVDTNWSQVTEVNKERGDGGYVNAEVAIPLPLVLKNTEFEFTAGYQMQWSTVNSTNTETSSVVKSSTSGLTASEWSTANSVGSDSIEAAFLNLNMHMVNTGTLSAGNVVAIANLRLGDFIIQNLTVGNGENGELPGRSAQTIMLQASTTGRPTFDYPTGRPLTLTMNQLRSIQAGAPLSLDVISFKADTLVWQRDPETGRRLFLSMGDWSPYHSAIQNSTARVVLDFNDDPSFTPELFAGLPIKRVEDLRVACFPTNGTYYGSPPDITLLDAFMWAFEMQHSDIGPVITIRDGVSNWKHTSPIIGWNFAYDEETAEKVLADPQRYSNLFLLPLEPGNPTERIYKCTAPAPGELATPRIYWALCNPLTRKIRAYSRDIRGIRTMRFKPDPTADYEGEEMQVGYDPRDPDMSFFYTYEVPLGYHWTGFEQVVAVNLDGKASILPVQIEGESLGTLIASNETGLTWNGAGTYQANLNFQHGLSHNPPADLMLSQSFSGTTLTLQLTPDKGQVHDALIVLDGVDSQGQPLNLIDYNYLRKQSYGAGQLTLAIPETLTNAAPPVHTYGVRSSNGAYAVMIPQLSTDSTIAPYRWHVSGLKWRTYEGI